LQYTLSLFPLSAIAHRQCRLKKKKQHRKGAIYILDAQLQYPSFASSKRFFRSHCAYTAFFQAVSSRSAFAVRLLLLIFCGALSRSYASRSCCPSCHLQKFTARHFFICPRLGVECESELRSLCREENWEAVIDLCLHRFCVFKLLLDDPSLTPEESSLFDGLDASVV
jgi:hypothetical protein